MLVPHLYLNGRCEEAIALYVKAFGAEERVLIRHSEQGKGVMHAEIYIHGQRVMMNDVDGNADYTRRGGISLVIIFDNEEELMKSYEIMKEGSHTLSPMQATDYSPCVVDFRDRFGILWGFMVGKS